MKLIMNYYHYDLALQSNMLYIMLQELGMNNEHTKSDRVQTVRVSYCCENNELQDKLMPTLKKHAENIKLSEEGREMDKRYTISYSVWDELGSLCDSLKAFKVCKPSTRINYACHNNIIWA